MTGANGDIGDAIGRLLRQAKGGWRRIGADANGAWPGSDVFADMRQLPYASAPGYPKALRDLIAAEGVDRTLLVTDNELARYAADRDFDSSTMIVNSRDILDLFTDKLETVRWLAANGMPALETVPLGNARDIGAPVIVKPRRGHGSRGLSFCLTSEELAKRIDREPEPDAHIAQRAVGNEDAEYTCALVKLLGEFRFVVLKRWLFGNQTGRCEVASVPAINGLLTRFGELLPDFSFVNVQLMFDREMPWVFEVNPRFSSTVLMRHLLGFEDLIWTLDALDGVKPPPFVPPIGRRVFRMSREVVAPPAG